MVFVAELAEILMDFSPWGWDRGGSDGEALSVILATELHPIGYYQSGRGPRVNSWLSTGDRPDWVTETERTDKNWVSFGCGILFINYMRFQLGFSLDQIIRTMWGQVWDPSLGPSLAQRYDQLTGVDANWAYPAFAEIIAEHIPPDSGISVASDNIFPLRAASERTVSLSTSSIPIGSTQGRIERIKLKLGFICEETFYDFWRTSEITELDVSAFGHGFAAAKIAWSINGLSLPTHGAKAWIDVPVNPTVNNPNAPATDLGPRTSRLIYLINDNWNRSNLAIRNTASIGNYDLVATATATETAPTSASATTRSVTMVMDEVGYEMSGKYYADRRRCNPEFAAVGRALSDLVRELAILKNAPDPPPEMHLDRILDRAEQVIVQIANAAEDQQVSAQSIRRELISPAVLADTLSAVDPSAAIPGMAAVGKLEADHRQEPPESANN